MDLKSILLSILKVTATAYIVILLALIFLQAKLVYHPFKAIEATPENIGLAFEDLMLQTSDGVKINAWYVPCDQARGTVIVAHGNAGNLSHRLDTIAILKSLQLNVMIFDYRGYGKSGGTPSEKGTYLDIRAARDFIVNKKEESQDRIIYFGRSLGGAVAVELACEHEPAALIIESAFSSIPDMGKKLYPFLPIGLVARIHYDSTERIGKIRCPKLIMHSPNDDIVPFEQGRLLFEKAVDPKQFFELSGDHNQGFMITGSEYITTLQGLLDRNLPGSGQ